MVNPPLSANGMSISHRAHTDSQSQTTERATSIAIDRHRLAAMYKTGQKHLSFPYINLLYFLLQTSHFHNITLPRVRDCRAERNWSNISSALNNQQPENDRHATRIYLKNGVIFILSHGRKISFQKIHVAAVNVKHIKPNTQKTLTIFDASVNDQ